MSRILVIGDIHEPCCHPGYLAFCRDLQQKYRCNEVVFIGDVADWHAVSFHARHPEMPGPKDEYRLALQRISRWYEAFPKARVCIGNHDERLVRLAESVGIPEAMLRPYAELWVTPKWEWAYDFTIDDVYYTHGTQNGGTHPAFSMMTKMLMSSVVGHTHTAAGIKWRANPTRRIFGMDTGCGIDERAMAFAYGKHLRQRAVIGAGVVLDGIPYHEIAPIGPGEKYNRSNFRSKR